jgi:hypothetical protein
LAALVPGVGGAGVEGVNKLERARLGGVTIDMMVVNAEETAKVALGPGLSPVVLGVVAAVEGVVLALAGLAVAEALGNGTAPEVVSGELPGGGGGGPVVVVATVEGDVEGGLALVDAACPKAVLASPRKAAAASASLAIVSAIAAPG